MHMAAAHAAIVRAIQASGAIVRLDAPDFDRIVWKAPEAIVIRARPGVFSKQHQYLTSYKGFVFHTRTRVELHFASSVEVVDAKKIWVPG